MYGTFNVNCLIGIINSEKFGISTSIKKTILKTI